MQRSELHFQYPEELVAQEPIRPSRVMSVTHGTTPVIDELRWQDFVDSFTPNDVIVRNDTKVIKRRLFCKSESGEDFEILFVRQDQEDAHLWQVLCPASRWKNNEFMQLPLLGEGNSEPVTASLVARGRVQTVRLTKVLTDADFAARGEAPLPPYIQKARGERHTRSLDERWYQTEWAVRPGSSAAPTASLHFSHEDFQTLRNRGVLILDITLHVGLGTYLPVLTENLREHPMHAEFAEIKKSVWDEILDARARGCKIWALGTTVTRTLESAAVGKLQESSQGDLVGETDLLILPGFEFQIVDRLMTNFHQPESTLLALVMAFADTSTVRQAYEWAFAKKFRLFSYGDLSVWK
jgi:S-adenosylmethionine:tRNA ribosyltransferase-isomerase